MRFSKPLAAKIIKRIAQAKFSLNPILNELKVLHINESYKGAGVFCFLNKQVSLGQHPWLAKEETALWQFNLHYFDFLFSDKGSEEGLKLIEEWIEIITPGDKLAWHPYPTSRRICNWIWFLSTKDSADALNQHNKILVSLRSQLDFLKIFIERDLLGNHLIANAQALITAGVFFKEDEAIRLGCKILEEQLPQQVLADGGHYERSPMYHSQVLEDLLTTLIALRSANYSVPKILELAINDMSAFLLQILEENSFPLLNDSAFGIAISPHTLLEFIAENGLAEDFEFIEETEGERPQLTQLEASGLVVVRNQNISLTFDVGELGPDFLLGHAHNDTLSLLLNLNGEQILTDSGVYEYQGPLRNYFRSASAHNVVMLTGLEPNEIWSSFRVGRRGYPANVSINSRDNYASASHTSYQHLGVSISRAIQVLEDGVIWIDVIESKDSEYEFETNLHFAPGCELGTSNKSAQCHAQEILKDGNKLAVLYTEEDLHFESHRSDYSEYFGSKVERLNLRNSIRVKGRRVFSYGIFTSKPAANLSDLWKTLEQTTAI